MSRVLKLPQPVWMEPMLATLTDARPAGDGWIYEPKLDGVRCLVFAEDGHDAITGDQFIDERRGFACLGKIIFGE